MWRERQIQEAAKCGSISFSDRGMGAEQYSKPPLPQVETAYQTRIRIGTESAPRHDIQLNLDTTPLYLSHSIVISKTIWGLSELQQSFQMWVMSETPDAPVWVDEVFLKPHCLNTSSIFSRRFSWPLFIIFRNYLRSPKQAPQRA